MMNLEELPTSSKQFDCRENVKPWLCKKCGFSSHVLPSLIRHKKVGCGNKLDNLNFLLDAYKCRNCEFVSCSFIITSRHEARCSTLGAGSSISYKTKFECGGESCSFAYTTMEELKEHATFMHLSDECLKFMFPNDSIKTERIEQFCSEQLDSTIELQVFGCNECEFTSKSKPELSVHKTTRHLETQDGVWWCCRYCAYKSKDKVGLRQHIMKEHPHSQIHRYECPECEFRTKTHHQLHMHRIRKHTPTEHVKWFECQQCEFKSKTGRGVDHHVLRNHTPSENMKCFKCEECPYKSITKGELNRHTIHKHTPLESIKWFECEECEFMCVTKLGLVRHRIRRHASSGNVRNVIIEAKQFQT